MGEFMSRLMETMAQPVSSALIHSLWQGSLVAIALGGLLFLLRRKSPNVRYAVACSALFLMLLTVVGTAVHVGARSEAGRAWNTSAAPDRPTASTTAPPTAAAATNEEADPGTAAPPLWRSFVPPATCLFPFWLMGVMVMSFYHVWCRFQADRLSRLATREVPAAWDRRLLHMRHQLHLRRPIRMVESALVRVPAVVGWLRPVILVPASAFTGLSVRQLELLLAHELAHVRRHDVLVNYLQVVVETCLFYHPAAWWVSRKIRIEREHCCDDLVVGSNDPLPYARALAQLEGLRSMAPALAQAVDKTPLLARIRRLTGVSPAPGQGTPPGKAGYLGLWLLLTLGLGYLGGFASQEALAETRQMAGAAYSPSAGDFHGRWSAEQFGDVVVIKAEFPSSRSSTTFRIDQGQLQALRQEDGNGFRFIRDAGTFYIEGQLLKSELGLTGSGPCHYRIDPVYVDELERLDFGRLSPNETFRLAIHDVTLGWVNGLAQAGYQGLTLERLLELHIHDVSPEFIDDFAALGYENLAPSRLVEMRIHGVTLSFIRELEELGYENLSTGRLVEMRVHEVTPSFIRSLEEQGGGHPSPRRLIEIKIHGSPGVSH